jgi:mRNA-degrading endonuclease toxin of MazEF toxin-antitoxin module
MRPGEVRDRRDTPEARTVVVLSSEMFNEMTKSVIVAPFQTSDEVFTGIPVQGGYVAFTALYTVPASVLGESHGFVGDDAIDEAQSLIAGAMSR